MVVVVDSGKQCFTKKSGLGFARYYLIVEI
jgi:hypothetical protein